MMNKDKFRVTVLCEDKAHYYFVRGYLEASGFNFGKITSKVPPSGRGSGEQYVREKFVKTVKSFRRFKNQNIILVVVTDADKYTYQQRLNTLTNTLQIQSSERIIILIPARNIETWFQYADDPQNCNENIDYKSKYKKKVAYSEYGKRYAKDICHPNLPPNTLFALKMACAEIQRLVNIK